MPKVTVVTVNYNNAKGLARTMTSVLEQTHSPLEYVLIDGGSSDNSAALIQEQAGRIARWVIEPDKGVYDAMNKGVGLATGDWIIFMNAGDTFLDSRTVADVFALPADDADLIYGDMLRDYEREGIRRLVPAQPASVLPLKMPCSHQSLFARIALLRQFPFSQNYSIVADHEFMLHAQMAGARLRKVDRVIGVFTTGGKSDQKRSMALDELACMLTSHGALTAGLKLHLRLTRMRALGGALLRGYLPDGLLRQILKRKPVSW